MEHKFNKKVAEEQGLGLCDTCGGAEASLTTECCGRRITTKEDNLIMKCKIDYREGRWLNAPLGLLDTSSDGICITIDCNNKLGDRKNYCRQCKKERAEHFRKEYHKKMGWDKPGE